MKEDAIEPTVLGRPTKKPNHALARLRKQLSSPKGYQMTRRELARKTGVPERSLQDIEANKYKLSPDVAARIAMATKVSAISLMNEEVPLKDDLGRTLSPSSGKVRRGVLKTIETMECEAQIRSRRELFEAVLEAAVEKDKMSLFVYSFDHFLLKTVRSMGLENALSKKLTERMWLALVDPNQLRPFNPKDQKLRTQWDILSQEISDKEELLLKEKMERLKWDCVVPNPLEEWALSVRCRAMAIEELQQQKSEELGLDEVE
jgi:transcriptional regulator with XRE-family HTH domain